MGKRVYCSREKPINNWGLEAEINGTIDNVWNANLSRNHQKGVAILVNAGWNRTIQAGQSATIGIKVEQASFDDFASILLTQSKEQTQDDGYAIEYSITSQWNHHAIVEASIHNTGKAAITDWKLVL